MRIADAGGKTFTGSSYSYPSNSKDNTVKLIAPIKPGDYQVVYLMGKQTLASEKLKVGGTSATVKAPATVQAGGDLEVLWTGPDNPQDYISIVPAGSEKRPTRSDYAYTSLSTAGGVVLVAPEELGAYELAYFTGGKILARKPIEVVKVSASLEAPEEIVATLAFEVEWSGPGNRQDRIAMIDPKSTEKGSTLVHVYVVNGEATVAMTAPKVAGDFELQYWTQKGKVLATRPIRVSPAPTEPGQLRITAKPGRGFGKNSAVEVILDASGSMLKRQGEKRRIEIAKETLLDLIGDTIPAGTSFALRVFGHKEADSCRTDLEIPLGPLQPGTVKSKISAINAMNLAKTPIAASLAKVGSDLSGVTGERVVILLTDGEETCDGDPALAIRVLRSEGSDVRVNIIGYSIDDAALRETFQSWAAIGGGQYLDAPGAEELARAMRRAFELPFGVYAGDRLVASGITGDGDISLPAGDYQIRYQWDSKPAISEVKVISKQRTETQIPSP